MSVVYNEIEPYAAAWLRNLSSAGHIARGSVDERSVAALEPADVAKAVQFHAFAGIGAWSYALRLAGWPDERPVWTGSCPCQPFSVAGKRRGTDDERHLWPDWFRLIRECRPPTVFGEQVASRDGYDWLDAVLADLEGAGYAVGAAVLPAAGVGAPHIRHRLFFGAVGLADAASFRRAWEWHQSAHRVAGSGCAEARHPWHTVEWLPCRDGTFRPTQPGLLPLAHGAPSRVGRLRAGVSDTEEKTLITMSRVGMLRAYGNAIVPQAAATFIRAFRDAVEDVQHMPRREGAK